MNINLVLSGGGARGLAHLGVIKVLQETGLTIQKISGVSSGAVIGAFIAAGYKPDDILQIFMENKLLYQIRPSLSGGMFRMTKWEKLLLIYFPNNSFEALNIPLIINAVDINECKTVYFSSGELALPLLASSTVPGLFKPIVINKRQLVDGGVLNNLPVEPLLKDNVKIIASLVNPLMFENKISSVFKIIERSALLAVREKTEERKKQCHISFEPEEISKFSSYAFDNVKEIFETGYRHASGRREELEKLIS